MNLHAAGPPAFLRLAANPVRWQLLSELARSDRQVRELTVLSGRPQNLVSYHLGQLRTARLVTMRRSSADAREAFYSINLLQCADLLGSAGAALHPGLQPVFPPPARQSSRTRPPRVLFLCTGNSARSQIAEALVQRLSSDIQAFSAGSHPKQVHTNAIRVMHERGIDLLGRRAKHLKEFADENFDYVVTLCDRVREICPEFADHPQTIHWSIADPASSGSSDEETYPAFERTANELEIRIRFFLHLVRANSRRSEPR